MSRDRQDVNLVFAMKFLRPLSLIFAFSLIPFRSIASEPSAPRTIGDYASLAMTEVSNRNFSAASQQIRRAQSLSPDDALLQILIGAVLIQSGDADKANLAFNNALKINRDDPLALYGRSLCKLATGSKTQALADIDLSEANGGEKSVLLLARRYSQWLSGASISMENAALPENLRSGQLVLEGMQSVRVGNFEKAASLLEQSLSELPGDSILQPIGPLMTFDGSRSVDGGQAKLSVGSLIAPIEDKSAFRGRVEVSPGSDIEGVFYVSYDLDDRPLGIVNSYPFKYIFDTTRALNGTHALTITLYDRGVTEIKRISRKIRVLNAIVEKTSAEEETQQSIRVQLWQMLSLKPDRRQVSYLLGKNARLKGRTAEAKSWFLKSVALQQNYLDARLQWIACGGDANSGSTIWGGATNRKLVALTFDDGPKPGVTEPLLEILKEEGATATFFVIGRHVTEFPELTKQISDAGMEIANHSYSHPNLTKISSEKVAQEALQTQAAVLKATGKMPKYLRPPGGNWNESVAKTVRAWGLIPCMWTVDVYGSEVLGAQQVANAVLTQVRPGSIILMHNGKVSTLQALPTILRELKKQGYTFVTVDAMVKNLNASKNISGQTKQETRKIE